MFVIAFLFPLIQYPFDVQEVYKPCRMFFPIEFTMWNEQ